MADTSEYITASQEQSRDGRDSGRITRDQQRGGSKDGRTADVSSWGDHTPSGLRGGIDEAEATELARRERQKQRVSTQDRLVRKFDHTQFVAHVSDRITYNRNGDMMITIQVPYQFKHLAVALTDAFGVPLSFDVEVWQPYKERDE
jgi:hypothetical protein